MVVYTEVYKEEITMNTTLNPQDIKTLEGIAPYFAEELAKGKTEDEALKAAFERQMDFLSTLRTAPEAVEFAFKRYMAKVRV